MKKIYILLFALFATILISLSCKRQGIMVDTGIGIKVINQQGQNLLSPPTSLNMDNIDVYYVENGAANLFYDKDSGSPKGFVIGEVPGSENIFLYPNDIEEEFPVTLIKFGSLGTDTIKCQFDRTDGDLICKKVWLNGELKYTHPGARSITIVK